METQIILTNHAKERIKEYGLDEATILECFKKVRLTRGNFIREVVKIAKYGKSQFDVNYGFTKMPNWGKYGLLYTFKNEKEGAIIITITKRQEKSLKFKK